MKTRVKLYVSAVNMTLIGDKTQSVIHLNAAYSPDPSTENYAFWKATPSGTFRFYRTGAHNFSPGQQYYVDIEPNEDGDIGLISKEIDSQWIRVMLASPNQKLVDGKTSWNVDWEHFDITITNEKAWDVFENNKFSIQITQI